MCTGGRSTGSERHFLAAADRGAVGGHSGALRSAYDLREPLQPVAQGRALGSHSASRFKGLRWRHPNDQLLLDPRSPARRQRSKKDLRSRCMGRSRGGLTTKIHALVDAEGLPISLKITEGQAHDGASADDMIEASAPARPCWPIGPMIPTPCASLAERGACANVKPIAARKTSSPSANGSIASATRSNASSTKSNTTVRSPPATTNATTTSSPSQTRIHPHLVTLK